MRVALVAGAFYPAVVYGGPTRSTLGLAQGLARVGCEVRVLTTNANGPTTVQVDPSREHEVSPGVWVRYVPRLAFESTAPQLLRFLPKYARWAEVIHLTSVYNFPTLPTLAVARTMRKPLVWSPRGALQRWSGTRNRPTKAAWELACRLLHPSRMVLHVTSEEESVQAAKRIPGVRIATIPNGVDVPHDVQRQAEPGILRILFLGRLDPIKGLENLLDACSLLGTTWPWRLTIAGAGSPEYARRLEERSRELGLDERVQFAGPVGEDARGNLFAQADVLILPSHSENFGMVVVEALAHGVPVIAGRGTPWSQLQREGCGMWVDNAPAHLAEALREARTAPLMEMGDAGRRYVLRSYSWDTVCLQMLTVMRSLVDE